jgi:hypothetical protein
MLKDLLNWEGIKAANARQAATLNNLFLNSQVLAAVDEGDYQGTVGYAYLVFGWTDFAKIVVLTDSYGSCSGCDIWQSLEGDGHGEEIRNMCIQLANNAHNFDSIEEAIDFLEKEVPKDESAYWDLRSTAASLASELKKKLEEIKEKGL